MPRQRCLRSEAERWVSQLGWHAGASLRGVCSKAPDRRPGRREDRLAGGVGTGAGGLIGSVLRLLVGLCRMNGMARQNW